MPVVIVNYGLGNFASVKCALEKCGAEQVVLSDDPESLKTADKIILPGVGAFTDGMSNLAKGGWIDALHMQVLEKKIPLLGICLGMQLMAEIGHEGQKTNGLGLIRGEVVRLVPKVKEERIPHVGWNEITKKKDTPLLNKIANGTDFYFIHSYHVQAADSDDVAAVTSYAGEFVSVIAKGNIFGAQFHPEKSQRFGAQLLKNFLEMSC